MSRSTLIVALVIAACAFAASGAAYANLPDRVPTHWNIKGEIDGYGPKSVATFLTPGMMLFMILVLAAVPYLSPAQFKIDTFRSTYQVIVLLVLGLFAYIHVIILWATLRPNSFDMSRVLMGGMFLFFAMLGNVLGKVRRNFYVGIRVPWTIASERVWNETHRLAAWTFVGAGVIGFILTLAGYLIVAIGVLIVAVIVPIVYSFLLSKRLEREGHEVA